MAAPTKPLLPVPGMTPAMASNPSASVDPFAAFPDAQAALSTTALLPPFELNARPTPTKEPQADAFADYPDAPAPAAPEADFSAYPDVKETRGYDIAKLKAADATTLAKDKAEFNPVEFYAQHKKDLLNDSEALKKVEDVYAEREKEQMTVGDIAKGILTAPLHPIETGKTAVKAVKGGAQVIGQLLGGVGQVAATAGQAAGALSAGDLAGASGHLADTISAFDAAQQRWVTTVTDKIAPGLG